MTELQKITDNTPEAPFQDKIPLTNFYAGAGRGELLVRMKGALEKGAPLMVISGSEGSGKTTMCRKLESECPSSIITVFFPRTVESFEDVVRMVAQGLGLVLSAADEGKTVDAAIEKIIAHLLRQSKGLLVIFDEAEDIYLATLERIRKMLDRITAAGVRMQILFSGRKTFLENCEQLSICDFRNTEDLHFDLLPLTEQETADYLRVYTEGLASPDKRQVFNDEVVRNIHGLAKGKFRKINFLADKSLRSHGDDTSFMTLLDSVKDEAEAEVDNKELVRPGLNRSILSVLWIGGVLCTLILLFFFLRPGEERRRIKPIVLSSSTGTAKVEVAPQAGGGQQQPAIQSVAEELTRSASQHPEVSPKQLEKMEQKVSKEPETGTTVPMETSGGAAKTQEIAEPPAATPRSATKKDLEPLPAPVQKKVVTAVEVKVPELRQIPPLKVKPEASQEPSTGTAKVQPRTELQESGGANVHLTVDQLYRNRLNAGTVWASGKKNDKFTVQIMVLTAKNAELNLKKMLAQPNYRQEAGNFFIFKKGGSLEVVLVFYGEYPTLDLARLAQNSLPPFLRDHQPYAISVKGAIAKVGK